MPEFNQGEIWWADLPQPAGRRPVLILTRSGVLQILTNVTVAPLTRTIRGIESEVVLTRFDGVPTDCAISLDNITTIRKESLDRKITSLIPAHMMEVFDAIRFVFEIPDRNARQ